MSHRITFATESFRANTDKRTITGLVVPWNKIARAGFSRWRFEQDSLSWSDPKRVKLNLHHDSERAVGYASKLRNTPEGLEATFKVADFEEGTKALRLADGGVLDGLSAEVDFEDSDYSPDPSDSSIGVVRSGRLLGVALTSTPAFDDSRVARVTASRDGDGGDGGRQTVNPGRPLPNAAEDPYAAYGAYPGPPSLMPSRASMTELFQAVRDRRAAMVSTPIVSFATVTTTESGKDTQLLSDRGGPAPRRIAEIARLSSQEVSVGSAATFPVFGSGAAGTAAEGAAKTEYANIAPGTAAPVVINAWTDITLQVQSLLAFESKLRNKISRLIATRENELLRAKAAGTTGIQTLGFGGVSQSARILQGAALVEAAINVPPDVFLFNPADTETIFGDAIGNAAPGELARMVLTLHGMVGVPLSTQPAGFVLAGAWSAASRLVVGLRPTFKVDPFSQMKNNIVTVLGEEAVDLAVEEPEGFISIDIVTP